MNLYPNIEDAGSVEIIHVQLSSLIKFGFHFTIELNALLNVPFKFTIYSNICLNASGRDRNFI